MTKSEVHATAHAYQKVSNAYERGRPEYTDESVQTLAKCLNLNSKSKVLDLGAGTGKFTKLLLRYCPEIVTVEPVPAMREKLSRILSEESILAGNAETIPFDDQSLDAVVVANAFHWFDAAKAYKEIYRVLKPGGGLAMIWLNDGVFTSEWGKTIDRMIAPYEVAAPQRKTGAWRKPFDELSQFTSLQETQLLHTRKSTPELILDRVGSLSFIAALPETENLALLKKVGELFATHPQTRNQTTFEIDCSTDIYWCFKR